MGVQVLVDVYRLSKANVWWDNLAIYPEAIDSFGRKYAEQTERERTNEFEYIRLNDGRLCFFPKSMGFQHFSSGGKGLKLIAYTIGDDGTPHWGPCGFSCDFIQAAIGLFQGKQSDATAITSGSATSGSST